MSHPEQVSHFKDIIGALEDSLTQLNAKNAIQHQLCTEYVGLFEKFCKSTFQLASKVNEHANKIQNKNSETTAYIFKALGQSLNKVANVTKDIAVKGRNQVVDPLKLFTENCATQNKTFLAKLRERMAELSQKYAQMQKNRQNYVASSQRMEKNKKIQGKLMMKIENGDIAELEKFNSNIKRMTEGIKVTEEQYAFSVRNLNTCIQNVKKQLDEIATSLAYNQESRLAFTKKTLICCIRNLKPYTQEGPELDSKLDAQLDKIQAYSNESILTSSLNTKIKSFLASPFKEQFESYEQMQKRKRKKQLEEQNRHLAQIFLKVKEEDKSIMKSMVKAWFEANQLKRKSSLASPEKKQKPAGSKQEWEKCRQKIINVLPYSYYFVETIYEEIIEMSSIHCKLQQQNFMLLLELFTKIIQNLKLNENGSTFSISIEFLYRIIHISMRVIWKKNKPSARGLPLELLCQHIGRQSTYLQHENIFLKLNSFLERKKLQKKGGPAVEPPKGMMDSFMKGMQEAMSIKKEVKLSDQEQFSCLTELTYMMANLLTPNQVAIPVIKKLLGKGENQKSFQYLKSILFNKKDQQERQKIFFRTEVKGKMEAKLNRIIATNKQAEYCLKLTAKLGFLDKSDINLRLVCRDLQSVHQLILYHLKISPQQKWIHLIPHNKLNFPQMRERALKQGLPHSIEEIIVLDVHRSLHNHTDTLSQETLRTLLRVYAYYNKDIGYCQGMNYIAGYLYLKSSNEEDAYRLFEHLMQSRFKELFANEFEVLKVKLYQFERLLAIFHPEISDHFKKQGITSECYIVAWIITIFASSYQYTQQSYLIDLLWERFIIWGWREFFRFVLALFDSCKEELIELTYDKAMHFLGGLAKSDLLRASKQEFMEMPQSKNMELMIQHYEISQELLEGFEKEYQFKQYK